MAQPTPRVETPEPRMLPLDDHNRKLLDHVHPGDWKNPEPKDRYHLVVIGAGTAGLVSAAGTAGLGAKVALIERNLMGGDCLNVGCVPSKGIIRAARAWHAAREAREFGGPEVTGEGDFGKAMERMRRIRADISPLDGARRFTDLGVDVFIGSGRFTGPDTVEVDGQTLRFRRAVIATGARAAAPPIPGLAEAGYLTNETVFELTEKPRRLAVIGAGPIGCELSQTFARLGTEVHLLEQVEHILPREDPDAAAVVEAQMKKDGVDLVCCAKVERVERRGEEKVVFLKQDGHGDAPKEIEIVVDEILVGVGRAPNTDGLGLEEAGVEYDRSGVKVDDRLRTTNPRVFAAGDIASKYKFTHAADFMARTVIRNAFFFGRAKASDLVIPWCTYTSPEIAHVGMYEKEARDAGHEVETIDVPLAENDRAMLDGEPEGFLRVHLKGGTDRILGATLVASHAGDMIGEMALAITHRIGLAKVGSTIHPYPTQGEVFRKAADLWNRKKLTPRTKRFLATWFKIFS